MTLTQRGTQRATLPIGDAVASLLRDGLPVRFTAYDGSAAGPTDAEIELHLSNQRGLSYLLTAPGDLGMAGPTSSGDLQVVGVHPGDPYEALKLLQNHLRFRKPAAGEAIALLRGLGLSNLKPPPPPPQEHLPRWRRVMEGVRHSMARDAEVIHHHYDVSNRFYEMVLGPSMTYTCAVYPSADATLEEAQTEKYDLVARKLGLQPGQRLLDIGCGWGGMVRHAAREYGVNVIGVTLSREQAAWAQEAIKAQGLDHLAEVRFQDYRLVEEGDFDAISSIGLTEHIGVRNYPAYFGFIRDKLRPQGRLLNHCITRHDNIARSTGAFIDRYVFPTELIGSGASSPTSRTRVSRSSTRRTSACTTPRPWPAGAATWSTTGTSASPRWARGPRGCGASTWPARGWPSSATRSSSTTCWQPRPTPGARAATRCGTPSEPRRPVVARRRVGA
nr:cyclopropane-fatty-acyl-phospholipid synthase family protein [Nocardioides ungokensis]